MAVILVVARCSLLSYLTGPLNPPTYEAIRAALASARTAGEESTRGAWVGAPRVTRTDSTTAGAIREWSVTAAALYAWPTSGPWREGEPLDALAEELRHNVAEKVGALRGSWDVVVVLFNLCVNNSPT